LEALIFEIADYVVGIVRYRATADRGSEEGKGRRLNKPRINADFTDQALDCLSVQIRVNSWPGLLGASFPQTPTQHRTVQTPPTWSRRRRPCWYGLSTAASQLIDQHNATNQIRSSAKKTSTSEKAREVGQHCLPARYSILDPCAELLPGFEKEAPIDSEVTKEAVYSLRRENSSFPSLLPLRDH
jgi:hypothetical protein